MLHEASEFYFWLDLVRSHGSNVPIVCVIQSCLEDQTSSWPLCLRSTLGFGAHLLHIWNGASGLIFSERNLVHECQNSSANRANAW